MKKLLSGALLAPALALLLATKLLRLATPEPPGLAAALRAAPAPKFSEEDRDILKADGVVLVRGLLQGEELLSAMREGLRPHAEMKFDATAINHKGWLYNGATRALLRDGPLAVLFSKILGEQHYVRIDEAPIWAYPARKKGANNSWHVDSRGEELLSLWLVLTDSPEAPLHFVRKSHWFSSEIEKSCAREKPGAKRGFKEYNNSCVDGAMQQMEQGLNMSSPALYGPPLSAGDAYVFHGRTLHRGFRQTRERVAISVRLSWKPDDSRERCSYLHPHLQPPHVLRRDFGCLPWALAPSLPSVTPWLPPGGFGDALVKLLGR